MTIVEYMHFTEINCVTMIKKVKRMMVENEGNGRQMHRGAEESLKVSAVRDRPYCAAQTGL